MYCKRTKEKRRCQQKGKDHNKGKTRVNIDKERPLGRKNITNPKRENSPWKRIKANMERKNLPWKKSNEHIKKPTLSQRGAKWAWREWAHRKRTWRQA